MPSAKNLPARRFAHETHRGSGSPETIWSHVVPPYAEFRPTPGRRFHEVTGSSIVALRPYLMVEEVRPAEA